MGNVLAPPNAKSIAPNASEKDLTVIFGCVLLSMSVSVLDVCMMLEMVMSTAAPATDTSAMIATHLP